MKRLCEVKEELRPAAVELVYSGGSAWARMSLDTLRCPRAGGHCDKSGPCLGMTPENRQTISKIQDRLFAAGFVRVEEIKR